MNAKHEHWVLSFMTERAHDQVSVKAIGDVLLLVDCFISWTRMIFRYIFRKCRLRRKVSIALCRWARLVLVFAGVSSSQSKMDVCKIASAGMHPVNQASCILMGSVGPFFLMIGSELFVSESIKEEETRNAILPSSHSEKFHSLITNPFHCLSTYFPSSPFSIQSQGPRSAINQKDNTSSQVQGG